MSRPRQTYPHVHIDRVGYEPDAYLSHSAVARMARSPQAALRGPVRTDWISAPAQLGDAIVDLDTIFSQVKTSFSSCKLTTEMQEMQGQFYAKVGVLYDLLESLIKSHQETAIAIRGSIERGDGRGYHAVPSGDPTRHIKAAQQALQHTRNQLSLASRSILDQLQDMQTASRQPRGKLKVVASKITTTAALDISGTVSIIAGGVANAMSEYQNVEFTDTDTTKAHQFKQVIGGLLVGVSCLAFSRVIQSYCPDAPAYQLANWETTKATLDNIEKKILNLMNVLASLTLYWHKMQRVDLAAPLDATSAKLLTMATVLDAHVKDCRMLSTAIRRNTIGPVEEEIEWETLTVMTQQRMPRSQQVAEYEEYPRHPARRYQQ